MKFFFYFFQFPKTSQKFIISLLHQLNHSCFLFFAASVLDGSNGSCNIGNRVWNIMWLSVLSQAAENRSVRAAGRFTRWIQEANRPNIAGRRWRNNGNLHKSNTIYEGSSTSTIQTGQNIAQFAFIFTIFQLNSYFFESFSLTRNCEQFSIEELQK